jgi:hypothetical protein
MRLWFGFAMLSVVGAAMFACGSSAGSTAAAAGTPTGPGGSTSSSTTSTTSTGGSTSSSTTGAGGSGGAGGAGGAGGSGTCTKGPDCQMCCINGNMQAATVFEGYELKECGCAQGSPCVSMCTAECADPTKLMMNTPCGQCLLNQANMGTGSACTVTAGLTDCANDPMCAPFINCVTGHCL